MINENEVKRNFGNTLRMLRNDKGFSQEYIAEKSGLHRTYISDVERGDRNLSLINICKICKVLEVEPSTFFCHMEKGGGDNETSF